MTRQAPLSRRQLLSGVATLPLLVHPVTALAMQPASQATANPGLTAITAGQDGFDEQVNASFPGLLQDVRFQAVKATAILIQNPTKARVKAFTVTWAFTTATGSHETTLIHHTKPGSYVKERHRHAVQSAEKAVLAPGAVRLITPFFSWTPAHYAKHQATVWTRSLPKDTLRVFLANEMARCSAVTVRLGNVAYRSKKLTSQKDLVFFRHLDIKRNAQHDEAVSVQRKMAAGGSHAEVHALLREHQQGSKLTDRTNKRRYFYYVQRKKAAIRLLHKLTKSPAKFEKHVSRLLTSKKSFIHKTTAA